MSGKELYYAERKAHPLEPDGSPPTPFEELATHGRLRWETLARKRLQGISAELLAELKAMVDYTGSMDGHEDWPPILAGARAAIAKAEGMLIRTAGETVGRWIPVTEAMPADEITVLVWVSSLDDATIAYHCSKVLEKRGDSGWIRGEGGRCASRVLLGVTHWCQEINPPKNGRASA
jgi:hypothetical protein